MPSKHRTPAGLVILPGSAHRLSLKQSSSQLRSQQTHPNACSPRHAGVDAETHTLSLTCERQRYTEMGRPHTEIHERHEVKLLVAQLCPTL